MERTDDRSSSKKKQKAEILFGMALNSLGTTLCSDVVAAALAALIAAPLVAIIDQATNLNAAGRQKLWPAMGEKLVDMVRSPMDFLGSPAFQWLFFVYGITYASANAAGTISNALNVNPALPVLIASTLFNMWFSILKDAAFARLYGKQDSKDKAMVIPMASYVAWFSATSLPWPLCLRSHRFWLARCPTYGVAFAPIIAQYFTKPLHLMALAMFNLPTASIGVKLASVRSAFVPTVLARQLRILPAVSVAGVANQKARKVILDFLIR